MIYTVTFNPSLDYVVRVTDFELGNLHRAEAEELYVGGKGINVTTVLRGLEIDSTALGFVAGFTGREIVSRLMQLNIPNEFIPVAQGMSRINMKLKSNNGVETEVNGQGPRIAAADLEKLYDILKAIRHGDILLLSGSVPKHIEDRNLVYANICELLRDKKIKLVVDTEGDLLLHTLKYRPFLIKPNHHELGDLFGRELLTEESMIECALLLQKEGAQNVLISMAGEGAILVDANQRVIRQKAPKGKVINSVGAGDSLLAGFLTGLLRAENSPSEDNYSEDVYAFALKYSVAAGSAAAFSEELPTEEMIEEIFRSL
ncbi:MAG TPA: 1-phosphofructokinase [Mobilitalea sp.]|nr:1-phosphofructokinase [Mobilitalea sp.]